ncbi:MAG: porin [Hyphomicrobiaceae bacterium]
MFGGFLKSTSAFAILASAGVVMSGVSAQAADLGGNCCADLEERVAELEATTVRKGNRKVSLQLYGQVSQSLMYWDDGGETNTYLLENDNIKNRIGVRGSARITSDWSAGYNIELQVRSGRSSQANQLPLATTEGQSITVYNTRSVSLRYANWYMKSNTYGTLTVGRQTDTTIGTSSVNLVDPDGFAGPSGAGYTFQGMFLRRSGTTGNGGLSGITQHRLFRNGATIVSNDYGPTLHGVKYTSPFFLGQSKNSGFMVSAGWGNDDVWGAALRYVEDFGTFRVAAAVGYAQFTGNDRGACTNLSGVTSVSTTDCSSLQASGSIMHVPTGLYVSGGWAEWSDDNRKARYAGISGIDDTDSFWYVQAGWQAKLNTLGNTIFWGQYMEQDIGFTIDGGNALSVGAGDVINPIVGAAYITNTQRTIWGGGITQKIDAAAMALYLGYYNIQTDISLMDQTAPSTGAAVKSNSIADHQVVFAGATIKF